MNFLKYVFIKTCCLPFLCLSITAYGQIPQAALDVFPPMDIIYHPVSTKSLKAQMNFDKGMTYLFAYNYDYAFREFDRAAKEDPNLAIAYWGMAIALGQNFNNDVTKENEVKAYHYIQQALKLSENASKNEKGYIQAASRRYTNDPNADFFPLRLSYCDAMKEVALEFPEDLDAATIYAESILNINPWKWWSLDGKAAAGTFEAIDILESVLLRNPDHIGANHYYIHVMEASPYPERALTSANRLEFLPPGAGHLLHMPCHIYLLVGDYERAVRTSLNAIEQDKRYIRKFGLLSGDYPLHYLSHNLAVLSRAYLLLEDYPNAIKTAHELVLLLTPYFETMESMAHYSNRPLEIYLYFDKWKEILEYRPATQHPIAKAYWHFSRTTAYAALGEIDRAKKEKELFIEEKKKIPLFDQIANNPASKVFDMAEVLLNASFARAENNMKEYMDDLAQAADMQDKFQYDEPPAWYRPVSQILGFAQLKNGLFKEAEASFKHSLLKLHRNGRSLYGLYLSLKEQGRVIDAYWVDREMHSALKHASEPMK